MKYIFLFFISICLFSSCKSSKSYDDKVMECFYAHQIDGGMLVRQQLLDFEKMMVEKGIIASSSGEDFYAWVQSIAENGIPQSLAETLDRETIKKGMLLGNIACRDEEIIGDTIGAESSILYRYRQIMEDVVSGNLSYDKFPEGFAHRFNAKDYNHPILKRMYIGFISMAIKSSSDKGLKMKIPPWSDEEIDPKKLNKRNVLSVLVNKNNQLLVRGEPMKISKLKANAKEFILNPEGREDLAVSPKKAIISLKNDRGTNYKTYLSVLNTLKAAYNEIWNEMAMEKYGMPYDEDLPVDYKREIQKEVPLIISEAEPVDEG